MSKYGNGTCILALALSAACGTGEDRSPAEQRRADNESVSARTRFLALEESLLHTSGGSIAYEATATGAVEVHLSGRLFWTTGNRVRLESTGTFAGSEFSMLLISDGTVLNLEVNGQSEEVRSPDALNEAVVLGLTRMGVLHNLARLTGGAPPDHADGTLREWLDVDSVSASQNNGRLEFSFIIMVDGKHSGEASLSFDSDTLPYVRRQTVVFPEGVMQVEESYSEVELNADFPSTFFSSN